jgi:putative transposase
LRYDGRREVNKKKIHRLWREEGLQVKVHSPRKRAGISSIPPVAADAPNVVWAIDFQFDSTIDGKAIKIASMIDELPAPILDIARRNHLDTLKQVGGLLAAVWLHDRADQVGAASQPAMGFAEHGVGFAYPGRRTKVNMQLAALARVNLLRTTLIAG